MYPRTGATHVARQRWLVAAAVLVAMGLCAGRRLRRVAVTGDSMLPILQPGDRALALRTGRHRVGDIVACVDPRNRHRSLVKRVAAVPGGHLEMEGGVPLAAGSGYIVLGDNSSASTDSRHFGSIDANLIIGRLFFRYLPEGRAGVISRRSARYACETERGHALSVEKGSD